MTPEGIRQLLETHLASNWTLTPIAWDNFNFDPETVTNYIEPATQLGKSFVGEMGSGGIGHRVGSFIISIYVPPNTGTATSASYAGILENMFRKIELGNGDIIMDEAETIHTGVNTDKNKYQVNVKVSFNCFIGE